MKIGYSFWGFLADVKMNDKFERISTPDGNAFYSWSIVNEFQKRGDEVIFIMPDRDRYSDEKLKEEAYEAWLGDIRYSSYKMSSKINYDCLNLSKCSVNDVFRLFDKNHLDDLDFIIHEWRMEISSRNEMSFRGRRGWQPDLFLQNCLLEYCKERQIKLYIFDLDYKLSNEQIKDYDVTVIELGNKWKQDENVKSMKVYIPFGFDYIDNFAIKEKFDNELVYVGNRYERDWCIDKYIPEEIEKCTIYGNWKEPGRDSETRWPKINFGNRLQTKDMYDVYSKSACTILLAKEEYCKFSFMTARIVESIFYGTVPLFIEEYGEDVIKEFAGDYASTLTVRSKEDVIDKCNFFAQFTDFRKHVIMYLRKLLAKKMDSSEFVERILEDYKHDKIQ